MFYLAVVIALIITLLICVLAFPQYWGGKSIETQSLQESANLDRSCGIAEVDNTQKRRAEMQQDQFAAEMNNCKRDGIYLEIGSHHPIDWSNTYLLEKRLNWSGFCVDPFPVGDFSVRKCKLDKIALSSSSEPVLFDKNVADSPNMGGIAKFKDASKGDKVMITPETPSHYFARVNMPKIIDYLSIDVEGAENDILGAIDWKNFCARAITVEHNKKKAQKERTIEILTTQSTCKLVKTDKQDDFFKCDC